MENELNLKDLVGHADSAILVEGLRALWRERIDAKNAAMRVAKMGGNPLPDESMFGIHEVHVMLVRVGAEYESTLIR